MSTGCWQAILCWSLAAAFQLPIPQPPPSNTPSYAEVGAQPRCLGKLPSRGTALERSQAASQLQRERDMSNLSTRCGAHAYRLSKSAQRSWVSHLHGAALEVSKALNTTILSLLGRWRWLNGSMTQERQVPQTQAMAAKPQWPPKPKASPLHSPASVTRPPASSTITKPGAWSQIFSLRHESEDQCWGSR